MNNVALQVLLLDDEASFREPLAKFLREQHGFGVDAVSTGEEALNQLHIVEGHYEVALVDEVLTGHMSGLEVLREIKASYPDIEVIVFTGWEMDTGMEALNSGAYRYFAKPFRNDELALTIRFAAEHGQARRERKILSALQQVSAAINSTLDLNEILRQTCEAVVNLFGVDHSGFVKFEPDLSQGRTVAEYPHREMLGISRTFGAVIPVQGVLAEEQLVFQKEVLSIPDVAGESSLGPVRDILSDFGIRSILIVPVAVHGQTIASFSLDAIRTTRTFSASEIELCKSLANQVAVAIEKARLLRETQERADKLAELNRQLHAQNDYVSRLIANSPIGIVANDLQGRVTQFNGRAQEILGYAVSELENLNVADLYDDQQEAHHLSEKLRHAKDGKLSDHETWVRSKRGERIPVRVSLTWLYDANNTLIGCIGCFEDLRRIRETELRLNLLLQASNTVANAESLTAGLQSLAEMMVTLLHHTFCRILLLDEGELFLVVKAAYPISRSGQSFHWDSLLEQQIVLADWPGLETLIHKDTPTILRLTDSRVQEDLMRFSKFLSLDHQLQSLLIIPVKIGSRVIGLLDLGELRSEARNSFTQEEVGLASAVAAQTSTLIDRMRLHEQTRQREQLLLALDEASRHIRAIKETPKLLQEVVRLAAELANCNAGGLYVNHPHLQELELRAIYGLPDEMIGSQLSHEANVIGQVAQTGKLVVAQYSYGPEQELPEALVPFKTLIVIPLKQTGDVEAVLFVANDRDRPILTETDLEILERFAVQAAIALQTSQLLSQEQRMSLRLEILHKISDYIQASGELEKILHVVLTGVTAGYGLGFNRAALFLLEGESLVGRMGIGYVDEREARADWAQHHANQREDFQRYLELLEQNNLRLTPVDEGTRSLTLPVNMVSPCVFSRAIIEAKHIRVAPNELEKLPERFVKVFEPALPLVVVPLIAHRQAIGLFVADNKFTRALITQEDIEALSTFANTAAVVIYQIQLLQESKVGREKLRSFYRASNALVSSQDLGHVAHEIVEQARVAAAANGVSMILIDELGQVREMITAGHDKTTVIEDVTTLVRPHGLSMHIMQTGKPEVIQNAYTEQDRVNPTLFLRNITAALGLPISMEGRRIGVMWFHFIQPHQFPEAEIEAMWLYANQAAIAYDSARRIKELNYMRKAAEALAGAARLNEVLEQIVRNAKELLGAESAVILSYDPVRGRFALRDSSAVGIPERIWEEYRGVRPRIGGTADTIMARGWIGVTDVNDNQQYPFVGEATRSLLKYVGAKSFQGVALRAAEEALGVLYVNYNRVRGFSEEERQTAQTFANHAALALKKARLLDQIDKAKKAAEVVAQVTVVENLEVTLSSVAQGTYEALDCDAVTLYVYDQVAKKLKHPPTLVGVEFVEKAAFGEVMRDSLVYQMLERDELYRAEKVVTDPFFKESRFAREENIISCVAIALKVAGQRVGVMFVNYRSPHRFAIEELINIELFANQAAVAIRNAQLYDQMQNRARLLDAASKVAHGTTGILNIDELLTDTVRLISDCFGVYHAGVFLLDDDKKYAVFRATSSEGGQRMLARGHKLEIGKEGIVGFVAHTGKPRLTPDVKADPYHYKNLDLPETRTEVAFPLIARNQVIGVLDVQSIKVLDLQAEDIATLQTIRWTLSSRQKVGLG